MGTTKSPSLVQVRAGMGSDQTQVASERNPARVDCTRRNGCDLLRAERFRKRRTQESEALTPTEPRSITVRQRRRRDWRQSTEIEVRLQVSHSARVRVGTPTPSSTGSVSPPMKSYVRRLDADR